MQIESVGFQVLGQDTNTSEGLETVHLSSYTSHVFSLDIEIHLSYLCGWLGKLP